MFRELTRKKQQLPAEECIDVLKAALRGVLAVNGDDGYPYAVPINHYYDEEEDSDTIPIIETQSDSDRLVY